MPSAQAYVEELMQIRDLLKAQQWQQADAQTTALLLQMTGRSSWGNFDVDAIKTFPKQELQLIDKMWMAYSQGRFGFGIQFHLWSKAPRDIETWGRIVGWLPSDRWLYYHELNYTLEAPPGHLPVGFLAGNAGGLRSSLLLFDRYLLAKWSACLPSSSQGS
ncbi:MAG: GUN4 domain-containing protein [Synechococcaceae cyanobacterium SM2_3_2]|nr:GUN4 domain-containing protein [Synechococcaceae cyanobacterium SM2_3_2]